MSSMWGLCSLPVQVQRQRAAKFSKSISKANHALYTKFFLIKAVSLNEFLNNLYRN